MTLEFAVAKYKEMQPRYVRAAKSVGDIIEGIANDRNIKCKVTGRAKDVPSLQKKAIIKQYADPWSQITDKAGVRAVLEVPRHVDALAEAIHKSGAIQVVASEDKRQDMEPERLGYSGVHLQVLAPSEIDDQEAVECEVQLRTVAQDVWSIFSHRLLYKPVLELPKQRRRALYRLVALVELFDEEVQRALDALPGIPGYENIDLIEAAENEYIALVNATSNREFSAFVLERICDVIDGIERVTYPEKLHRYVAEHISTLKDAYRDYGPHSAMASAPQYALLGQAESLIILEMLSTRPFKLVQTWKDAGLPAMLLEPLLGIAGAEFLEIDEAY